LDRDGIGAEEQDRLPRGLRVDAVALAPTEVDRAMLSYALKLTRAIERAVSPFEKELVRLLFDGKDQKKQVFTIQDVLEELGRVQLETLVIAGQKIPNVQQPGPVAAKILEILNIKLAGPSCANVATAKKRRIG